LIGLPVLSSLRIERKDSRDARKYYENQKNSTSTVERTENIVDYKIRHHGPKKYSYRYAKNNCPPRVGVTKTTSRLVGVPPRRALLVGRGTHQKIWHTPHRAASSGCALLIALLVVCQIFRRVPRPPCRARQGGTPPQAGSIYSTYSILVSLPILQTIVTMSL
jgi:hypothetical protein